MKTQEIIDLVIKINRCLPENYFATYYHDKIISRVDLYFKNNCKKEYLAFYYENKNYKDFNVQDVLKEVNFHRFRGDCL